jgi:hypothetical protein
MRPKSQGTGTVCRFNPSLDGPSVVERTTVLRNHTNRSRPSRTKQARRDVEIHNNSQSSSNEKVVTIWRCFIGFVGLSVTTGMLGCALLNQLAGLATWCKSSIEQKGLLIMGVGPIFTVSLLVFLLCSYACAIGWYRCKLLSFLAIVFAGGAFLLAVIGVGMLDKAEWMWYHRMDLLCVIGLPIFGFMVLAPIAAKMSKRKIIPKRGKDDDASSPKSRKRKPKKKSRSRKSVFLSIFQTCIEGIFNFSLFAAIFCLPTAVFFNESASLFLKNFVVVIVLPLLQSIVCMQARSAMAKAKIAARRARYFTARELLFLLRAFFSAITRA